MDSAQRPSDGTSGVFNSNQLEFESSDEFADESADSFGAKIIRKNLFCYGVSKMDFLGNSIGHKRNL